MTPAANLDIPTIVTTLEATPAGTPIQITRDNGINIIDGTFHGLATQTGYRYAKVEFTYKGRTVRDLVFLAAITALEVK